jgi:hypothetical protein
MLQADVWNKKTELTVKEAIQVPGATLSPGNYVVKLVDSQSNRHIVQFTNEREDRVISTVLAIPNERLRPTGETEFSFYEGTAAGEAPALRAWFYPGDTIGQQFAYPKQKALDLERMTGETVPVAPENITAAESTAPVELEQETPAGREQRSAAATRTQPAAPRDEQADRADRPDPTLLAQAPQQPATPPQAATPSPQQPTAAPSAAADPAEDDLPATASPAPLLGFIGLISLGAGIGLQRLSKRKLR